MQDKETERSIQTPPRGGVERAAAWMICLAGGLVGVWFLFRYALGALLPFLLAYPLALCIRPLVRKIATKTRIPRGLIAGLLVILLVGGVVLLLTWGCRRAVEELNRLVGRMAAGEGGVGVTMDEVRSWFHSISDHLPFPDRLTEAPWFEAFCDRLDLLVRESADNALNSLGTWASGTVMDMVGSIPTAILFITVLLLSCYYLSADDGRIGRAIGRAVENSLPARLRGSIPLFRRRGRQIIGRCLRAYFLLALITFVEVFIGLTVLRMPYALLMALVVALVDFLPLFGAGAVLIPWAILQFVVGQPGHGVGLLVLWAVISIIRQAIEPRLVSAGLGIHPLLSLLAMYVGLRFFGLVGMILCPPLLTVVLALLGKAEIRHTPDANEQPRLNG